MRLGSRKPGKTAPTELGNLQVDRAGARLPEALSVAVAGVLARYPALAVGGAAAALHVEIHEALGDELQHLPHHIDVAPLFGELRKCDTGIGHRGSFRLGRLVC